MNRSEYRDPWADKKYTYSRTDKNIGIHRPIKNIGIHGPIRNTGILHREFFSRKVNFFLIYVSKDPHGSCEHFHIKISVVGWSCVGGKKEKLIKNPINYNYLVTSSMTSPSWLIPHMKALDLKFCIASRLSLATTWWRSRAIRRKI